MVMNRAMKDSRVEWIGKVPEEWDVQRLKNILIERKENNKPQKTDNILSLMKDRGVIPYSEKGDIGNKSKTDLTQYKLAYPGDIVLNSMNVIIGSVGLSKYFGAVSPVYYMLRPRLSKDFVEYYNFIFQTEVFQKSLIGYGNGIMEHRMRIPMNNLNNVSLPVPPSYEQKKIATFLDEKVSHIDNIIEDTKKSIENLKAYKQSLITETVTKGLDPNVEMKDSGIDWVGKIPKHWMLRKIKHLTSKIGSGKTPRGGGNIYSNEGILFLRSQNIYETGLYLENATYISPEIDDSMKSTRVYSNDVLLNITGGSIGRACVYPQYIETHANVNQHVCILRPIQGYTHPSYLFYYLISHVGRNYIRYYQTGGNREGLNFEQIGNFAIPSFSIHEQTKIVNYLDEKTSQVDQIVNQQEQLVKEFESYKKSIIYEYVTGKKEVK